MTGRAATSLTFTAVDFSYNRRDPLLRRFSLTFPNARTTAVMGPSGCGKTTILKLAGGLLQPTNGRVTLARDVLVSAGMIRGLVFHEDTLLPWLNLEDNLRFHAPRDSSVRGEALELLSWLGLGKWARRLPFELSAGMRKRVEFARAILADKRFLLLDEPFSSLDEPTKMRLWAEWAGRLRRDTRTRVLTTHDPYEAASIADSVVVLSRNRPVRVHGTVEIDKRNLDSTTERIREMLKTVAGEVAC